MQTPKRTPTLPKKSWIHFRKPKRHRNYFDKTSPGWTPKTFKLPKPSTYKLTNGDIGHVKKVLQWQPEDDEDTAVLPALPLTVHEEIDAGKKLVDQVCESDAA